jgi:Cu-processing system permease protein
MKTKLTAFLRYLSPALAIARGTWREVIRERLLYGVFLIATLAMASSFFLSTISFDQNARVLQNIGLASIQLFAAFIMIFVTANSTAKDFERRALYLIFPKPISRVQYVIGKYIGLLMVLLTTLAILGGLYIFGLLFGDRSLVGAALINLAYAFLEISLITALTQLFASFAAPINSSLYSIGLYIIGHSLQAIKDYTHYNSGRALQWIVDIAYYLLPNLEKFNVRPSTLYGLPLAAGQVVWSIFYGLLYICVIVYLTTVVMRNREV